MDTAAITSLSIASSDGNSSSLDDEAVFNQMAQGMVTSGLAIINTLVGDAIDSLSEPFGDPDQ